MCIRDRCGLCHKEWKSVQGFDMGACPRKRHRTVKKSQRRYISPSWGEAPPNLHQNLRGGCRPQHNHVCKVWDWHYQGLRFYRRSSFRFSYYNSDALPVIRVRMGPERCSGPFKTTCLVVKLHQAYVSASEALPDKAFSDQKCTKRRLAAGLRPDTLGSLQRSPRLRSWAEDRATKARGVSMQLLAALKLLVPSALDPRRLASRLGCWETECSGSSFFQFEHCLYVTKS